MRSHLCAGLPSIKQNNNVHIGNHLYSENQRKRGKETQQWYFKTVCQPGNSPYNSLQKNPDDCQIFFAILLHILLKTWKRKKNLKCWLFHWPLGLRPATFKHTGLYILKSRWTCGKQRTLLNVLSAVDPVSQTKTELDIWRYIMI